MKEAFDNWNSVREFDGETFSDSVQKKSSSSSPSQVFEGQIENLTPVQCKLAQRICAAPVGLEAPPANASSTAERTCSKTQNYLSLQMIRVPDPMFTNQTIILVLSLAYSGHFFDSKKFVPLQVILV